VFAKAPDERGARTGKLSKPVFSIAKISALLQNEVSASYTVTANFSFLIQGKTQIFLLCDFNKDP
jgi:hypothetical protein